MTQNEATEPTTTESTISDEVNFAELFIAKGTCACGCGQPTSNAKSTFRQGHDQRFMGWLVEAHRQGKEIAMVEGDMRTGFSALTAGSQFLSDAGMAKLRRYLDNQNGRKRSTKRPTVTSKSETVEILADPETMAAITEDRAEEASVGLGAMIQVKVGRWIYPAEVRGMNQAGKVTAVEYTDKKDVKHHAEDGKFTVVQ